MSEHTKLPWQTEGNASDAPDPRWQIFNDDIILAVTCGGNDRANAEYIVLACNSLETMRTTLEYVLEIINNDEQPWWMTCPDKSGFDVDRIEAAITAAKPEQKSGSIL